MSQLPTTSRFQRVVEYILDNLIDILTVGVAGYLVIRHQFNPFGPDQIASLLTWILAVIGLLAISGLWDRSRRLQRIEKLSEEGRDLILRRISGRADAADFFISKKHISDDYFASASTICLTGMTLNRTIREYVHILGKRLIAGATVRIIILEPMESLLEEMARRSMGDTTIDFWRSRLETVETLVEVIAKTPGSTGKLEFRKLPYIPSFGFMMIDPYEPHGVSLIELYHHESAAPNPTFELKASEDPYWYKFFLEQFEILWESSDGKPMPRLST